MTPETKLLTYMKDSAIAAANEIEKGIDEIWFCTYTDNSPKNPASSTKGR